MTQPGHIEFRTAEEPVAGPGEILLRIKKIGVCGSDIHVWHGEHPYTPYPVIQGHEFSAVVEAVGERILDAELDEHLEKEALESGGNRRNGTSKKTVLTGTSKLTISVPRDRAGSFDPKLIAKYQRRFPDFDEKIISMYARGLSVREIRAHLEEIYGIEVSPDLISAVTDAVLEEVAEWQNRPLDAVYPLVFFDAIRVKIRDEGFVRNKAVYIALGILPDGNKEILGIWIVTVRSWPPCLAGRD